MSETLSVEPSDIYATPLMIEIGDFAEPSQGLAFDGPAEAFSSPIRRRSRASESESAVRGRHEQRSTPRAELNRTHRTSG